MSQFDDMDIDWNHPSLNRYSNPTSNPTNGSSSATGSRTSFTPNVNAARPNQSSAANGRTNTASSTNFMGGSAVRPSANTSSAPGFMSRPNPSSTASSNSNNPFSRPSTTTIGGNSLPPPQPGWLQRAYGAPSSSPLATHQSSSAASSSSHRMNPVSSSSNNSFQASNYRFQPNGALGPSSGAGPVRANSNAAANNAAGRDYWNQPRSVAFPSNFMPNTSSHTNYNAAAPASSNPAPTRVAFVGLESDKPKGSRKRKAGGYELGVPLPAHLQQYVHLPRTKLPDHLTDAEKALIKKERKQSKAIENQLKSAASESRKNAEVIDLDLYHQQQTRESRGWNSSRIKVSFQLASADRIAVETNPRNEYRIAQLIQSIQGAVFDRKLTNSISSSSSSSESGHKGLWTMPISSYDACVARCISLRNDSLEVVIVPLPQIHLRGLQNQAARRVTMKFESMQGIPKALAQNLYEFQRVGVEYCVSHNGRALIGDEMGLGKTLQSLAVAAYYQDDWPLLVVCPSSVRLTWKNEILKWLGVASLNQSDVTILSSDSEGEDADTYEDFGDAGDDEDIERALQPQKKAAAKSKAPAKPKSKAVAEDEDEDEDDGENELVLEKYSEDYVDDDADFEQILKQSASGSVSKKSNASSSASTKQAPIDSDEEGEAEYQSASKKSKSSKRSRMLDDDDEDADIVVPASEDDESDDEDDDDYQDGAEEEEEEEEEEDSDEEYVPVRKGKSSKRRRIVDDDEDEDEDFEPADESAENDGPVKSEKMDTEEKKHFGDHDDEIDLTNESPSPESSFVSPKDAFKAKLEAQIKSGTLGSPARVKKESTSNGSGGSSSKNSGSKTKPTSVKQEIAAAAPIDDDAQLQEDLRLIAEMEANELKKVKEFEKEAFAPKAAFAPAVKKEEGDMVADEIALMEESVKEEEMEPAPYVSAASLLTSIDPFEVKKTPSVPIVKSEPSTSVFSKPVDAKPSLTANSTPKPNAPAAAAAASTASTSASNATSTTASESNTSSSSFGVVSKGPIRPVFRPVLKHEINVILNGKSPLMGANNLSPVRVVIMSYDLVAKYTLQLQRQKFNFIICDESHYVKNASAQRSQALLPLLEQAKRVVCLSGTPAMSRPFELYPQIHALCPGKFGSTAEFGARYCEPKKGFRGKIEYKGNSNLHELHTLLKEYCLIRRLKKDVLKDLRPKTRTVIVTSCHDVNLQNSLKRITNVRQMVASEIDTSTGAKKTQDGYSATGSNIQGGNKKALMALYSDTAKLKLPFILNHIKTLIDAKTKFLIFAHHLFVLDGIEQCLVKEKVGYFRLDGSTAASDRQAGVERFQTDPNCLVAVLSITAGGTGLTLTAASTVVFAELQWTPALLVQCEDRVHRIGQFNPVNIYYIIAHHTLDEILWPMVEKKLEVIGATLDGKEDALAVSGIQGTVARSTNIHFKKAAPNPDQIEDLTDDIIEEKKSGGESSSLQRSQSSSAAAVAAATARLQATKSSNTASVTAPASAPSKSSWIGMSNSGKTELDASSAANVTSALSKPNPFMSTASASIRATFPNAATSSTALNASAKKPDDITLNVGEAHEVADRVLASKMERESMRINRNLNESARAEFDKYRIPNLTANEQATMEQFDKVKQEVDQMVRQPAAADVELIDDDDDVEVISPHNASSYKHSAGNSGPPPSNAVISLRDADDDDDYSTEESDEEVVTSFSVREALERSRAKRAE